MLKTYDLIKKLAPKLGEDEAKDLIFFVEESRGDIATKADLQVFATKTDLQVFATKTDLQNFATKTDLQNFATKSDLQNFATKGELLTVKADLEKQIQVVRTEIQVVRTEVQAVRAELKTEIQTVKSDILKWQFGFWITIIIAILIKGFLKL